MALHLDRILLLAPTENFLYTDPQACAAKSFSCHFHTLIETSCAAAALAIWAAYSDAAKLAAQTLADPSQQFFTIASWQNGVLAPLTASNPYRYMPSFRTSNPYVYAVIGRPKAEARRAVRAMAERVSLTAPYTSMHIRHGDKSTEAVLVPFSRYLAELQNLRGGGAGRRRVWVATDNVTLLQEELPLARRAANFLYNSDVFQTFGGFDPNSTALSQSYYAGALRNRTAFFFQTWTDVALLAGGETFMGARSSGMAQLVAQIRPLFQPHEGAWQSLLLCMPRQPGEPTNGACSA